MPRPRSLARALAVAALAPACFSAAPALADPIVPAQNSTDTQNGQGGLPDGGAKVPAADDAGASGGAASSAEAAKPAPGVFPENDGALHTSVQANDPMTAAKDAKPIVPAGG